MHRDDGVELLVIELQVLGLHVQDTVAPGNLPGVGVGVDPDDVNPSLGKPLGEMTAPTTHLENPFALHKREQPINRLQMLRVPPIDQCVAAGVVDRHDARLGEGLEVGGHRVVEDQGTVFVEGNMAD